MVLAGRPATVTASLGIALSGLGPSGDSDPAGGLDPAGSLGPTGADGLLRAADLAMYAAKRQGRGHIARFDENMRSDVRTRLGIEGDLREALAREELRLCYEPLTTTTGDVAGAEVLIRWHHPDRGLLTPEVFLPVADETGLTAPLGRWVLETACREASRWPPRPPDAPTPRLAIGVYDRQLHDERFVADVRAVLDATNTEHRYQLCLEIAESALPRDDTAGEATLRTLHELGITVYLDDFGFGPVSLNRLCELPIDGVKTDRRLVAGLTSNPADHALIVAVIQLAHALDLTVIAEGVDTPDQASELDRLHCDFVQGSYLAHPASHDARPPHQPRHAVTGQLSASDPELKARSRQHSRCPRRWATPLSRPGKGACSGRDCTPFAT
ncbi:GGDEF domain-containing protein [Frankia sp. AgB1.9]|nr:GGDEF domain-containing protein [Frankia sp. AgW1.1]MBL7549526.1 GGDEF domain-containing protein [Frankia sp. AgB1.9]MBL7620685.1 GGDEF domain-containing protein [Frankia sp. AgB1.8]